MRTVLYLLLLVPLLAACGSRTGHPGEAARVGGAVITRGQIDQYLSYAGHYAAPGSSSAPCLQERTGACTRTRNEILARLIEEQVVQAYAARHHVHLSPMELLRASDAATAIMTSAGGSSRLGVKPAFLRAIVTREFLVEKVENAISPPADKVAVQWHIRKVYFPRGKGTGAYRQAIALATNGGPIPAGAAAHALWVLPARVRRAARGALRVAAPGQFVGPFKERRAYVLIELLGHAPHRLPTALRSHLELSHFQAWLRTSIQAAHPRCFSYDGEDVPCPFPAGSSA